MEAAGLGTAAVLSALCARFGRAAHTPNPAHTLGDPDSQHDVGGADSKRWVTRSQAPKARLAGPATRRLPFSQRALCSRSGGDAEGCPSP